MTAPLKLIGVDLYEIRNLKKARKDGPPSVSVTKPSLFYFQASCDSHYGVAEICVSLTKSDNAPNPFYQPALRLRVCCEQAPRERIQETCQETYDTCIRPIQWAFQSPRYVDIHFAMDAG
jgi:hypothetical protein